MKIIALQQFFGSRPDDLLPLNVIPDSAMVVNGNPLFLPDFADRWTARIYPSVKICRLGKAISRRFASRYYDAMTLSLRAVPDELAASLHAEGKSDGLLCAFDNCIVPGEWCPVPHDGTAGISVDGTPYLLSDITDIVDESISLISRYLTLKIGDIIMPGYLDQSFPLEIGNSLTAKINQKTALNVRIR